MAHKPTREDVERMRRELERPIAPGRPSYLDLAGQAATRLKADGGMKRTKRIMELGTLGYVLSDDVSTLFAKIREMCGSQAAIDLFEQAIALERTSKPKKALPKKRKGPHNSDLDKSFLELRTAVKQGLLPLKGGESPKPCTDEEFAKWLIDTPEKRARWGVSSVQNVLRKIKYLNDKKGAPPPK